MDIRPSGHDATVRRLVATMVILPFMLVGGLSAATAQSVAAATSTRSASGTDATADRESYTQKARDDLHAWQLKLSDFDDKAEKTGRKDLASAKHDLHEAWARTATETDKLKDSSAEGWQSAKLSYEKASNELAADWDKVRKDF